MSGLGRANQGKARLEGTDKRQLVFNLRISTSLFDEHMEYGVDGPTLGRVNRFALATDKHVCAYVTNICAHLQGWGRAECPSARWAPFYVGVFSMLYNLWHHCGLPRSIWNEYDVVCFSIFSIFSSCVCLSVTVVV